MTVAAGLGRAYSARATCVADARPATVCPLITVAMLRRSDATSSRLSCALAGVALAASLGACADVSAPSLMKPNLLLRPVSDTHQVVLAGRLASPPDVRVVDPSGAPVPGAVVNFRVVDGDGLVARSEVAADSTGYATTGAWVTGARLGIQRVEASLRDGRSSAAFSATVFPETGPLTNVFDDRCPVSDSLLPIGWQLPRLVDGVLKQRPLTVIAIGSSSTAGVGATTPDSAYPALLQRHLRAMFPASPVRVINAGIGGQRLSQLRARFAVDVAPAAPHLVILQTGTIDAMFGVPIDTFDVQLRAAVIELRGLGADVMLMDSQRYPEFGEGPRYRQFQALLAQRAAETAVPLMRRYAWMSEMMAAGTYGYAQLLSNDVFHPSDLMYSCTGRMLAEGIVRTVAGAIRR